VDRLAHGLVDGNNEPHVAYGWRHLRAGTEGFYAGQATQMRRVQEGKSGKIKQM
jgi:hypothetical protein